MFVILPVALLLVLPFSVENDDPLKAYAQAEKFFAADRPGRAEPLYRAAIRSKDTFAVRRSYERLLALYIKSGRPDRAIQTAGDFRDWLKKIDETNTAVQLEVICGECYIELALYDRAEGSFASALDSTAALPPEFRLRAYRGRAEVARLLRSPRAAERWKQLEETAMEVRQLAERSNELPLRILADTARAQSLHARNESARACELLAALPELHDRLNDPLARRDTQRTRGIYLSSIARVAEAEPLFREAIELHRKRMPKLRMLVGDILADWAAAVQTAGRRSDAAELRSRAAVEYQAIIAAAAVEPAGEDLNDRESPFAAFAKLQQLTRASRQFRKALDLAREAGERWSGDAVVETRLDAERGIMELLSASYPLARELLQRSLKSYETADPPDLRSTTTVLVNLAATELAIGDVTSAERYIGRATDLYRTRQLPDDALKAECEYLGGAVAMMRGGYAEAMTCFRRGIAVCDVVGASTDPVRFNLGLSTALIYKEQGDNAAATDALDQAAVVLRRFAEPGDLSAGLIAAVRADLDLVRGKIADAIKHVPEIERTCTVNGIVSGFLVSTANHVRAMDKLSRRELPDAEKIWTAEAVRQRAEGHILLPRTLNYLGIVSELQGRDADAKKYFEEARTFQSTRPRSPPVTKCITLWRLAVLADKAGQPALAKQLATEVFDTADDARRNTFGEAAQRAAFFSQFNAVFELLARWHARDGEAEGLLRVLTRSRSRTLLDQILAAGVDPRDRLVGPDRERLIAREATVRQSIAKLRAKAQFLSNTDPTAKQVLADLDAAQVAYADAWQEIINADPLMRSLTRRGASDASASGLPRDAAFNKTAVLAYMIGRDDSYAILSPGGELPPELFKLRVSKQLAETIGELPAGKPVYVATRRGITLEPITQPNAPPLAAGPVVPLTNLVAARIVDHYRRQITHESFSSTRGIAIVENSSERPNQSARSETLGDLALPQALRDRLRAARATRLVIIPDGALHKLPFESLVLSTPAGPKYALDELPPIIYAPSPAILSAVMARPKPTGPATLLTVGDPAYGIAPPGDDRVARRDATAIHFRGVLPRLPYSAVECQRIRDQFPAADVTSMLGEAATEKKVTAALSGKRYIHLAAHGFCDDRFGNLFAAIALTPPKGEVVSADDDGFLSMYEIHRLRLEACDMTVLSACDTIVGPQRPLEAGVTLASAFLCAGSRRVLASCWSVDDRATAELMTQYFQFAKPGRADGLPAPEAMKAARQAIRNMPGWDSPFFWAPFALVGAAD